MGNILTCCVCCGASPESDQDEGSGCPPESEICEAAAEVTTAAAPIAAPVEPAELTVEAGEDPHAHQICDGDMPKVMALESDPSDHPEAKQSQDDMTLESDPSDHPEAKQSQDDMMLESDPSDHQEAKQSQDDMTLESDPSDRPEAKQSQEAQEIGENSGTNHISTEHFASKFNSCSTIFIDDSTVTCPHFTMTLKSVALEIYYHIKTRDEDRTLDMFDERVYPFTQEEVLEEHFIYDPTPKVIFSFMCTLFNAKRLGAELAILSLVYIKRLVKYAYFSICPANWKRIIFGAILLVLRVVCDDAVCDDDFCKLFESITVEDMHELLMYFAELINYNTDISISIYTRYYFQLRELAFRHGLGLPHYLLDRERAWDLKALSRMEQDEVFYAVHKNWSFSADDLIRLRHAKAVLS
ncbi:cyclin-Y-like protein 2 [Saimiri boliviensis]|uniref:cyclin-Y-like protein 2 n=1 Tax=Saimiri boliviensis TaxID=27679 RepID=UPI003D7757E7